MQFLVWKLVYNKCKHSAYDYKAKPNLKGLNTLLNLKLVTHTDISLTNEQVWQHCGIQYI